MIGRIEDRSLRPFPEQWRLRNPRFLYCFSLTQAEIVTEYGLERFAFPMLKVTDVRRANRFKNGSNLFHVGALPPYENASILTTTSRNGS